MQRRPEYIRLLPSVRSQDRLQSSPAFTHRVWWLIGGLIVGTLFLISTGLMR